MRILRVLCVVSLLAITLFSLPQLISADLPPPIESVTTDSGGLYTTAANISMPYAEVNASIHLSGSWYYNINVSCSFYILSLVTQNLTTAFVYPSVWEYWTYQPEPTDVDLTVITNGSLVNHTILGYDEFRSRYDTNQTDWEKVDDCDFATFNFSINAVEPIFIDVVAKFTTYAQSHDFVFEYIVDTARGWEGDTHEVINLDFIRDLDTEIIEYRYYPNESLAISGNNYTADLTWDFHISSFEHDRIWFIIQQQEYPTYHRNWPPDPFYWLLPAAFVTAVVLLVLTVPLGLWKTGRL